jgi:hypothetical protein
VALRSDRGDCTGNTVAWRDSPPFAVDVCNSAARARHPEIAMFRRKRVCMLVFLIAGAALLAPDAPACDFYVNSNADNDQPDNVLTLREALAIANASRFNGDFSNRCRTAAELAQIPGADYVLVPPGPPSPLPAVCSYTDVRYTILVNDAPGANCGDGIGDNIRFDTNVGTIFAAGGFDIGVHDTIDGMQPNGTVVNIVGPGAGSGNGLSFGFGDTSDKWNIQISNLAISGFSLDGIHAAGCQNASFLNLSLSGNGRHGLYIDGNRCFTSMIGGGNASQRNYIYANGGDGIHIEGLANGDPTSQNNTIRNNWIGLDGNSSFDASGNAGAGIVIVNSLGNTIGGSGTDQGNAIAKNAGYGVWLRGPRSIGNTVLGNLIGSSPELDIGSFPNSRGVQIDGGASANTIGSGAGGGANVISGNANHGVYIDGAGTNSNAIQFNVIGLNRARAFVVPNQQDGIAIGGGAQATGVHDNVIAGNTRWGIYQGGASTSGTTISNNAIGLRGFANNGNDSTVAANGLGGILLDSTPSNTVGPGNRLAGNAGAGVEVFGETADGNVIKANTIGLNNAGAASPNTGGGVLVFGGADNTVIGGSAVADGNLISGNTGAGVRVNGNTTDATVIRHNFIGTDTGGNSARPNSAEGIRIDQGATNASVVNNLVSGNLNDGIKLESGATQAHVQLNQVGYGYSSALPLPNGASGISILSGANHNFIGDPIVPFTFNVIAGNAGAGVFVADLGTTDNAIVGNVIGAAGVPNATGVIVTANAVRTQILGNQIDANTGSGVSITGNATLDNPVLDNLFDRNGALAIDLGGNGVTANDVGDADVGPNQLQNFPVISNVVIGTSSTSLSVSLASIANQGYTITLYRSDHCDPSGFGEGQAKLGSIDITTLANGSGGAVGLVYSVPNSQTQASWGTAIATSAAGNTSEFGPCIGISDEIFPDDFE